MNSMKKNHWKAQRGFTIIEILLYMSLSVIMVSLIGGVGVNVLSSITNAKVEEDLQYNAAFIIEKMDTLIRNAQEIAVPLASGTSSTLSLIMDDPLKNPTVIEAIEGHVYVTEGSGEPVMLSGRNVVATMEFTNVTREGARGSLQIALQMEIHTEKAGVNPRSAIEFYSTINLQHP